MAGKIIITTPKGAVVQYKTKNGTIKTRIEWSPGFGRDRSAQANTAQAMFDSEVMRLMEPYMQLVTGAMIASMRLSSTPGTGEVIVNTPYARRVYYSRSSVGRPTGPLRGPYYFHRMKADKRDHLRRFAASAIGGK
ncbi:MAG: hypothetical protein IJ639_05100 [Ruminococcus sp.]|nr:hypothetical protein [Ruminococcus sp.]